MAYQIPQIAAWAPWLVGFVSAERRIASHLRVVYDHYTNTTSTPQMAISLRLACLLWYICARKRPNFVVDLGSGLSTVVFAIIKRLPERRDMRVCSVDTDEHWLRRTIEYLGPDAVLIDAFLTYDQFREAAQRPADLVLFDIGHARDGSRASVLARLGPWLAECGIVLADDVHKAPWNAALRAWARVYDKRVISLAPLLRDQWGRYAALITKGR